MRQTRFIFQLAILLVLTDAVAQGQTAPPPAQTYDFENGLDGWTKTGTAFDVQPVRFDAIITDSIVNITLGGDYWRNLTYPVGQHGQYLIATGNGHNDAAIGTLTSPDFVLTKANPYFSFLIGGSDDLAHERLELQVRISPAEWEQTGSRIEEWAAALQPSTLPVGARRRDGEYYIIASATGAKSEQLRQIAIQLPDFVVGMSARIKIIDDSALGHINADYIRFTAIAPEPHRVPVWGYADYHTHPVSYMAFGGLKGIHALWGVPGSKYDDYVYVPSLISLDIPHCIPRHGGGPLAEVFINEAQKPTQYSLTNLSALFPHRRTGGPEFADFPSFLYGAHQQMHITQIRRNYEGGLRLMVGIVTDNMGAEYVMSKVENRHVKLIGEKQSLEAQIAGMLNLAKLNDAWMQVAYTPEQAREIIREDKLALILGVEMDQLGTFGFPTAWDEVDYLWQLGIRTVTPIHATDNLLGGASVFIAPYNWLNDLLHRGQYDLRHKDLRRFPARFFQIKEETCSVSGTEGRGECVQFRLSPKQQRLEISRPIVSWFRLSPWLSSAKVSAYVTEHGHKNSKGLEPYGLDYIQALIDRGMIVDTAHMSDISVEGVYEVIGTRLALKHPECRGYSFRSDVNPLCNDEAYPTIISHVEFRAQAFYGQKDFPPTEYAISDHNVEMVRRVGGVLGPFVAEERISSPISGHTSPPFPSDCAMSSKSYGHAFHYGLEGMTGKGVGMATDFTFIPGVAPRFGGNACWAYNLASNPKKELKEHSSRYAIADQRDGVVYQRMTSPPAVRLGNNLPLKYYQMGDRKYDFNVDGLAHFGLIPDMLQDLKNLRLSREDFESLFSSAEAYLQMWEKAERISGRP